MKRTQFPFRVLLTGVVALFFSSLRSAEPEFGTSNIGDVVADPKWELHRQYLKKMIETVQIQWERILISQKANPVNGRRVTVKFILDDGGRINRIVSVNTTANEVATAACISGISAPAPYGPWTDEMRKDFGAEQEISLTFFYGPKPREAPEGKVGEAIFRQSAKQQLEERKQILRAEIDAKRQSGDRPTRKVTRVDTTAIAVGVREGERPANAKMVHAGVQASDSLPSNSEVFIALESEFGIKAQPADLSEETAAKLIADKLKALKQVNSARKDEFETTAEFLARRAVLLNNPLLSVKNLLILPQTPNSSYDADLETLTIDLPLMLFWGNPTSSGANGPVARAFNSDFPKDYFPSAVSLAQLKLPRERARELKPTLRLLVVARFPSPEAPIEDWMTESGRALHVVPTGLLVYSSTDGTVLLRKSFDLPSSLKLLSGEATIQDWLKASPQLREQAVSRIFSGRKAIDASELLLAVVTALKTKQVSSEEPVANLLRVPDLPRPTAPVPIKQTRPKFPFGMRRAGIAGEVIVAFRVREDGSVDDVKVDRSSQKEFEQAAMDCVAQWKFRPALLAGKPVAIYLEVPILFTLNEE